jgi:hypothetical protein
LETTTSHPSGRRFAAKPKVVPSARPVQRRARKVRVCRVLCRRAKRVSSQPSSVTTRSNRRFAFGETVLAQADGEGDTVIVEEFEPVGADELAVREQDADGRGREVREVAPDQGDARRGRAVPLPGQHRPEERHAEAAGHHGEHEVVHLSRPDRPVRPVEHQGPASRRPHQARDERQRPVLAEAHVLEEPLQPPVGRRRPHAPAPFASDMAEVDRAGTDDADDEQAERLETALAERDLRAQKVFEGGDGTVRHPDVSLVGVVQKITSSRPQPAPVV